MRDRFHFATLNEADHRGTVRKEKFYLTRHHVIERETTATIGHMADFDPGLMPEHLKRKMLKCAVAGRGHIDAVRCGFCVGDDISHGFHRH